MEQNLAPQELLRFLQAEAETLQLMQAKVSNELHQLQVEEEVYVRTLDRLNQNAAKDPSSSTNGNQAGMELLEALHQELASAVLPMSTLPPDPAPLAITETDGDKWESQLELPSDLGDDQEEYELLDALETGDVKL